jgi:hypothetical protein
VVSDRLSSSSWNGGVTDWVQHLQLVAQHFDLAAGEVGVFGAGRARAHLADDLQAELVAHFFGHLEHVGAVRVADDLHHAFAVAQVDEDHAAVVAAAVGPAHQGHGLVHQRFADQACIARSHQTSPESFSVGAAKGTRCNSKKGGAGGRCQHGPSGLSTCRGAQPG